MNEQRIKKKKNTIRIPKRTASVFCILFAALLLLCILFATAYFVRLDKSNELEKNVQTLRADLDSLTGRYNALNEQAQAINELVGKTSEGADASLGLEEISKTLEELKAAKATLETTLGELRAEKTRLESELKLSNDERYNELNTQYTALSESYEEMEKSYTELQKSYTELEKKLKGANMIADPSGFDSHKDLDKVCYLTFDDGPSTNNTPKILDILKQYDIKATFFVNKKGSKYDELYKRIVNEGHAIGNHTATHEYDSVYTTLEGFLDEFNTLQEHVYNVTGVYPQVFRFPGGSGNTVYKKRNPEIMDLATKALYDMGVTYFDWNVNSTDADVKLQTVENIIKNATNTRGKDRIIVLMHDLGGKTTTPEALPAVIEELQKQGYVFRSLNNNVEPVQTRKPPV